MNEMPKVIYMIIPPDSTIEDAGRIIRQLEDCSVICDYESMLICKDGLCFIGRLLKENFDEIVQIDGLLIDKEYMEWLKAREDMK